ncbi:A24 family peptidase [Streptomyces sp. NPDC093252]|uniref:A24 family peptidase n=1 Tax=Streptomyces sp. NPDC093252 TaxID=3154980 RepID=UPI003434314F
MGTALALTAAALLWGAATGTLLPGAAHRLSVPPDEPWRTTAPDGTALPPWPVPSRALPLPALTALTAVLCAGLAAAAGPRPELAVWLLAAPVGVLLAVVDIRVHRLPDLLTLPLAAALPAALGVAALLPAHAGHWPTSLLATPAVGAAYLALHLLNPSGLAFGDVKLSLAAGASLGWYGWPAVLVGTFTAFVSGALYGLLLIALRRANRRTAIPFGPFLLGGVYAGVVLGAVAAG